MPMPPASPPPVAAEWTPAFMANVVDAAGKRSAEQGVSQAITDVARMLALPVGTVQEWVSRARTVKVAPVPPGLLACGMCAQPMILIQTVLREQMYLCAPTCGRAPVPAEEIRDTIADHVRRRTPHLVPAGDAERAADYAPGAMHRVTVGATELDITWRAHPQQVVGPRMSMAQRLHYARQNAASGRPARAVEVLRSGLLLVDLTCDDLALDASTAQKAVLLARLAIAAGDPVTALPWAAWAHRSLRRVRRGGSTAPETRAALDVLATAHRDAGDLTAAAHAYSDLVRNHTLAEGPAALSTLSAQTDLALVLHQAGHCAQAQQLLTRTITTQRRTHHDHPAEARMANALALMHAACAGHDHATPRSPLTPDADGALPTPPSNPTPRTAPAPSLEPSTITCLECGNPYAALATHLSRTHKISTAEYRRRHNLLHTAPLASPATTRMLLHAKRPREDGDDWTAGRIGDLRRALGLTQQRFASRCGVTSNTVGNWERGRTTPQGRTRLLLNQLSNNPQQTSQASTHPSQVHPDGHPPAQPVTG